MTKKIKITELPEFDAAEYLASEEDATAYLATVTEDNDPELLASALEDITRAQAEVTKPKYRLAELIAEMPDGMPLLEGWDDMKPVGKENLPAESEPPVTKRPTSQ